MRAAKSVEQEAARKERNRGQQSEDGRHEGRRSAGLFSWLMDEGGARRAEKRSGEREKTWRKWMENTSPSSSSSFSLSLVLFLGVAREDKS